jgi:hypothetical protein
LLSAASLFAQDGPPQGRPGSRVFGKITAINGNALTVQGAQGEEATILVGAETALARQGKAANIADFKVGDFVGAMGEFNENKQLIAARMFGDDKPPQRGPGPGGRGGPPNDASFVGGKITAINGNAVTVQGRDGKEQIFIINENAAVRRNGENATLKDFKVGDFINARGARSADGQFKADQVGGGDQPRQRGPGGGRPDGIGRPSGGFPGGGLPNGGGFPGGIFGGGGRRGGRP